ncbi:caspase family protein [Methylocella sp.]|uniref:caspase family protein n=1 Tax=Methylocella sp. TaxID=1978226 RepID=UPI003783FF28
MPIRVRALLIAVLAGLLASLAPAGFGEARAERRVALVIGNSAYKNPAFAAPTARTDAEDVARELRALGFEVVLETDADLSASGRAIQQFARLATGADAALFYYAGHAVQHQGRNFLLPVDADVNDEVSLAFGAVAVDGVRGALERAPGLRIMALDAARSNPVSERLARRAGGAPPPPAPRPPSERFLVAYAAAPGEAAADGAGRNSPYSGALLRRLAEPGLEVETLFRRVAGDVAAATGGRQRPQTYVAPFEPFVLNRADSDAWDRVKTSDDPAALRDFLERFPSSFHAIDAQYRLKAAEAALRAQKERALREAEAERRRKEAAAQEAARHAELDAACEREGAALNEAREPDALRRLSGGVCPQVAAAAKTRLAELEARRLAEEQACRREDGALAALAPADAQGLRALAQSASCASVKSAAAAKLAALEAEAARRAELCRREDAEAHALAQRGDGAGLEALRGRAQCDATGALVAAAQAEIAAEAERARRVALQAACERDGAALKAIGERDAEGLKAFLAKAPCEPAARTAQVRLSDAEAALAREAAACRAEDEELGKLAADAAALKDFRARARCPATLAALDQSLGEIASREAAERAAREAACRREGGELAALAARDLDGLRALAGRAACADVKEQAAQKLAALEETLQRETQKRAEACRRDEARLAGLSAGPGDPAALEALAKGAECPSVVEAASARLAEVRAACRADAAALAAAPAREPAGLRALAENSACAPVRAQAGEKLAALEADLARQAQACAREEARRAAIAPQDVGALGALRREASCPGVVASLDHALAEAKEACAREEGTLAALAPSDGDGLRALAQSATCASVKSAAGAKVAALESEAARLEEACRREDLELASLRAAPGADAAATREKLAALKRGLACARLSPQVEAALRELPEPAVVNTKPQIRAAQDELARIGCLAPPSSGALDARAKAGFSRYFAARGEAPAAAPLAVDDALVSRLKAEPDGVCAPAVAAPGKPAAPKKEIVRLPAAEPPRARPEPRREARPAPEKPAPEKPAPARPARERPAVREVRPAREVRPVPAAPAQAASGRPSSASPIGVGF